MAEQTFIPTNLLGLEPDDLNDVLREMGEEYAEEYEEFQKDLVSKGALTFGKERSRAERLKSYYTETVHVFAPRVPDEMCILCGLPLAQTFHVLQPPDDLTLILDEDYLDKRRLGLAPPLIAEGLMMQAAQQMADWQVVAEQAAATGMEPPPQPQPMRLPKLWVMLLPSWANNGATVFNNWFFQWHQGQFRDLLNDRLRNEA